ncbi:pre-toxin TG domain-containing protein [Lihuaxuella thermophila]|uniref:pre-toxin TG domain-containing protein n=1 Tax=Lihuaxuella thermophila TaxID=1173111 RepID=UPI0011134FF6|nr:pre-toxin TG domain-containing protein [Lihuaxuella thermophila]
MEQAIDGKNIPNPPSPQNPDLQLHHPPLPEEGKTTQTPINTANTNQASSPSLKDRILNFIVPPPGQSAEETLFKILRFTNPGLNNLARMTDNSVWLANKWDPSGNEKVNIFGHELPVKKRSVIDFVVDLNPGKSLEEAMTGKNRITGEKLSGFDRVIAGIGSIPLPGEGLAAKVIGKYAIKPLGKHVFEPAAKGIAKKLDRLLGKTQKKIDDFKRKLDDKIACSADEECPEINKWAEEQRKKIDEDPDLSEEEKRELKELYEQERKQKQEEWRKEKAEIAEKQRKEREAKAKEEAKNAKWTPHGGKHVPPPNKSFKEIIEMTKNGKPAKYKPGIDIEKIEREAWEKGIEVNPGEGKGTRWKIIELDEVVGASDGQKTKYMRVEYSANTIHGHPITESEYKKLLKRKLY